MWTVRRKHRIGNAGRMRENESRETNNTCDRRARSLLLRREMTAKWAKTLKDSMQENILERKIEICRSKQLDQSGRG